MIIIDKIYRMLGMAKRAGKISSGEKGCKDAIRFGKSFLVILASDTGANTTKNISDSCKFYEVPLYIIGTMAELGHSIGHEFNAVVSVNDEGFAKTIEKQIANINGGEILCQTQK